MALQISSQTYDSVSCLEDIIKTRTIAEHELPAEIDYIQSPISYEEFFLKYLIPNKPCLFGPWATADWRSVKEWVTSEGKPDLEFLSEKFGNMIQFLWFQFIFILVSFLWMGEVPV